MKEIWPEKTGTLCAQMERGMSNQCVMSATMAVVKIIRGGNKRYVGRKLL